MYRVPARRPTRLVRSLAAAGLIVSTLASTAPEAAAQEPTGRIQGRVLAEETGETLEGVRVYVGGTSRGTLTDESGRYRIDGVPVGEWTLMVEYIGRQPERLRVTVRPDDEVVHDVRMAVRALPVGDVVVTTTREAESLSRTPVSVGVVDGAEIRESHPTHPSDVMGKVPGVWVNVTGGEGHMAAIRQPLTTAPVYLYLEDGVPTRSTGFFNHNALYEVNVPQAERIEVVKGPATALYGSDAIGGVVNVETRPAVARPGLGGSFEGGGNGWLRFLGSGAFTAGDHGVRADLNLTRTDGWRAGTAYDRQSATVRWDWFVGPGSSLKTVVAWSRIDQQTAGSSALPEDVYRSDPTSNLTPISFREVGALRVSAEYQRRGESSLLSVTPFVRDNRMDLLPNWSLTYDPALAETSNRSAGFLARWRRDFEPLEARLILGLDLDWSPGARLEHAVAPLREGGVFVDFTVGERIYDYDVTFLGVSPYLHAEASLAPRLRATAGLRFDRLAYDYENRLGELQTGPHRRPASTEVSFSELSPKLGLNYDLSDAAGVFASYSRGFRAPSEAQLFRQGVSLNTLGLEAVRADNVEVGLRGALGPRLSYQLSAYRMVKTDDILAFRRADDNRETQNAGETMHRGVEVGVAAGLLPHLVLETAFSYAKHTYVEWRPQEGVDFGGNEMEAAPRTIGTVGLDWSPAFLGGGEVAAEWRHLGSYRVDAENTQEYAGHDLLGLRAAYRWRDATVFLKVHNATDQRYAESASYSAFRGREFAPGLPRTVYAGVRLDMGEVW